MKDLKIDISVFHNVAKNRFEVDLGDYKAVLIYMICADLLILQHTEVPPPFEGRGIAGKMAAAVLEFAKKEGYKVENLIYESLPGFYVTASLFIPDKVKKPAPAILFCSGHSTGVYRLPSYQLPLLNLVKKGFIVLAIDPIGQGERLQYFDPAKGASTV